MSYIPYLSTLITFIFTIAVFMRYLRHGGIHLLFWSIGLLLYGLGTLTEVLLGISYHIVLLKIWYLSGAMLTAAWLGTGTVHLLIHKGRIAQIITWVLVIVSGLSIVLVFMGPSSSIAYDITRPASAQYASILTSSSPRIILTILLNTYGTLALVGGALYSAFLFWRKKVLANRMVGNIFIAAGALLPAMGGSFVKAGLVDLLYLSELLGVVLMFIGFLLATAPQPQSLSSARTK